MDVTLIRCVAYGSNLHPFRMGQRVPSAKPIDVVSMPGKRLAFHKRSHDGSGKCLFYEPGSAHDIMYGVVYEFDVAEKSELDFLEGLGKGYNDVLVDVPLDGKTYQAHVYMATSTHIDASLAPYDWYKELVLLGARYNGLPDEYVAKIESVASILDPNPDRAAKNEAILVNMRRMNSVKGC
jgi:hypothetical protein